MKTHYEILKTAFEATGVVFVEVDKRTCENTKPIDEAVKYLDLGITHLHFNEEGKFLGSECNGDGAFAPALGAILPSTK